MRYLSNLVYEIIPEGSYKIIRNCPKCGSKSLFNNTNNFRVNANGNQIDIWLIYQCNKCKHSYNLSIYERVKPTMIAPDEYQKFLANGESLAFTYGNSKNLFVKNKAEIDMDQVTYKIVSREKEKIRSAHDVVIKNPYEIKVRVDKVISDLFGITRSQAKKILQESNVTQSYIGQSLSFNLTTFVQDDSIKKEIY